MSKAKTYASVWDAIADTPEEAANLRARAELMQKIAALLKQHEWTQACVVPYLEEAYPQDVAELLQWLEVLGKIRFTLGELISDPRQVYVLRWIAGRHAGVAPFNPPYVIA